MSKANKFPIKSNFTPPRSLSSILTPLLAGAFFFSHVAFADPQSFATARADTIQTLTNNYVTLTGWHFAFIYNDTDAVNQYSYSFQLCAQGNGCSVQTHLIGLYPHTAANIYGQSVLNAIFTGLGNYTITATTSILGPNVNVSINGINVANVSVT